VAVTGLRGEWGPALDWPETTPAGSGESTDYPSDATDYRPDTTDYRSDSAGYGPLGYPDEATIGRPTEFTPLPPEGGNGPASVIPATAEETAEADTAEADTAETDTAEERAEADTAGADTAEADTAEADQDDGLPRRVRQASLAPQLRETPARPGPSADLGVLAEPPPTEWSAAERERSPEETRVTMSAIQRGWERGRSVFDPSGGNGDSTAEPGARTQGPDGTDATAVTDAVASGKVNPVDAGPGASGQAADAGITADRAAGRTDAGGAGASSHRTKD
jgi:hypothetical protein